MMTAFQDSSAALKRQQEQRVGITGQLGRHDFLPRAEDYNRTREAEAEASTVATMEQLFSAPLLDLRCMNNKYPCYFLRLVNGQMRYDAILVQTIERS